MTEEFRQCRRSSLCRESLPVSQLNLVNGKWICDLDKCPRRSPAQKESAYRVEKRYLNIAKIMFLSSGANGQEPNEFAEDIASKIEELTEEIVEFDLEVFPLEGGYIGHAIEGTELVHKKTSKNTFRRQIFEHWGRDCAYCGEHADTLDHVIPRHKGGLTIRENLVSCCRRCNGSKSAEDVWAWYINQPFYDQDRADKIQDWIDCDGQ